jgi:hypothetical protein
VAAGEIVATVKIIRYAVAAPALDAALAAAVPMALAAFRPQRLALIATTLMGTSEKGLAKTLRVTRDRVESLGGTLTALPDCSHDSAELAKAIAAADADILLIIGASATVDRGDVIPAALVAAGGVVDRLGERAAGRGERGGVASGCVGGPFVPGAAAEVGLERGEERVVVEPRPLRIGELVELVAELGRRPPCKPCRDLVEQARPWADHGAEVDMVVGKAGQRVEVAIIDEPRVAEIIERDHQRIARERGERLVGRVTVAGRPQRQHLPETLRHAGEAVEPAMRLGADLADAVPAGKRGRVKQDSGGTATGGR